jgi:putative intracellular protease/amidase
MDPEARDFLGNSVLLEEVNAVDFDLVLLVGGHGAMWDFTDNRILKQLLEDFSNSDKLIGSVSQGMTALLSLQNRKGGLLIKNKHLTTFSNSEEESSGLMNAVPFLLEAQVVLLGALYSKAANYVSYSVVDGNIITGQNPASSEAVARRMATWVQDKKYPV